VTPIIILGGDLKLGSFLISLCANVVYLDFLEFMIDEFISFEAAFVVVYPLTAIFGMMK
jgi:hypothetical protein